jgi:hypothetical protein
MDKYSHVLIVVDRLEYYITKEIERALFNNDGEKSFKSFYNRIIECINARKELNYEPIYGSVEAFLKSFGYDDEFISKFISLAGK